MATEKSCLPGADEDGKDADPEINAISLLQEPLKMAQGSSFTHPFSRASPKQNSVLDVLSNTDMFSPVGLENGPLHQATQANELNSISTEKEEEKSITPLKNVQEIESAEMWDFDEDSPDNLLTNLSSASHLPWGHQQELLEYLMENNRDCPQMESGEEDVSATDSQRRRKRKMDMVVMTDPSEKLSMELSEGEDSRRPRSFSNFPPTEKIPKFPNGTVNAIKDMFYNSPTRNSNLNHDSHGLSPQRRNIILNSHTEEKPAFYSCAKCDLSFKKEHYLLSHMKSHADPMPFTCRECGQSFRQSRLLIEHMSVHKEKKRVTKELKDANNKKEDKTRKLLCPQCSFATNCPNAFVQHAKTHDKNQEKRTRYGDRSKVDKTRKLFCPQCSFVTYYPNTFVQHAKTHEKEKKNLIKCSKCTFVTLIETDLIRHDIKQHSSLQVQAQKEGPDAFSCNICSYKAFSEDVFRNHLLRRHQQSFEKDNSKAPPPENKKVPHNTETFSCNLCLYRTFSEKVFINHILQRHQKTYGEYLAAQIGQENAQTSEAGYVPNCRSPPEDAEFTSKISVKNRITNRAHSSSESSDLSELLKSGRIERDLKSKVTESKLDKSINILLSRRKHCKDAAHQNRERSSCRATGRDSKNDRDEESDFSPNGHTLAFSVADTDSESRLNTEPSTMKKSLSKRKMSTPYHNRCDGDPLLRSKKILEDDQMSDEGSFQFTDTHTNENSFDNGLKKEKQNIMCTYSRRMSMRGALQASKRLYEKIKTEGQEPLDPEIKEEPIESEIYQETFDTHQIPLEDSFDESSDLETDRKSCPYCPAVFESGVGLSNHIRGHLHRVGLSYKARHVVSPEQVAYEDRKPRGRRKTSTLGRLKKAIRVKTDSETVNSIHSCPLCGDTFDNRTGQSNHIRGHLKKLGRSLTSKKKTPLMLLRELMRDKKELERALQILGRRRDHFPYSTSPKFPIAGRFTPSPMDAKDCMDAKPLTFPFEETESEEMQEDSKLDVKNSLSGATALIGILKKRKCQEETRVKALHLSKNSFTVSSNGEHCSGSRLSALPNSLNEKGEFNRKVCVHCNATFHSGVSLSNHLRAYEKRKKNALMEGTTFDCCKARRQRSRPGSKKKTLPLTQTPEEMYRLTCRFCDLVFQGPLSVQEDWIKHLQRHIMNTSVPHTGLSMIEVPPLHKDLQALKHEEASLTATHAAS